MHKILLISCLFISSITQADDLTNSTKTCANGAGKIVIGSISGREYCKSNQYTLNWWNAYTWCDALGMKMINRSDCGCSNTIADCIDSCPEFISDIGTERWFWFNEHYDTSVAYRVLFPTGKIGAEKKYFKNGANSAVCK